MASEVFALTDEQILGMEEPELDGAQDAETAPGSARPGEALEDRDKRDDKSGLADGNRAQPRRRLLLPRRVHLARVPHTCRDGACSSLAGSI